MEMQTSPKKTENNNNCCSTTTTGFSEDDFESSGTGYLYAVDLPHGTSATELLGVFKGMTAVEIIHHRGKDVGIIRFQSGLHAANALRETCSKNLLLKGNKLTLSTSKPPLPNNPMKKTKSNNHNRNDNLQQPGFLYILNVPTETTSEELFKLFPGVVKIEIQGCLGSLQFKNGVDAVNSLRRPMAKFVKNSKLLISLNKPKNCRRKGEESAISKSITSIQTVIQRPRSNSIITAATMGGLYKAVRAKERGLSSISQKNGKVDSVNLKAKVESKLDPTTEEILKKNLIKNPSGADGFDHWAILENNGNGFIIESPTLSIPSLPKDADFPEETTNLAFVCSYGWDIMEQRIDLWAEGLTPEVMKSLLPFELICSEYIGSRQDCGGYYKFRTQIGDETGRLEFHRSELEGHLVDGDGWEKKVITIQIHREDEQDLHNYRFLSFTTCGKDDKVWAGNFGTKFTRACVKVRRIREENKQTPLSKTSANSSQLGPESESGSKTIKKENTSSGKTAENIESINNNRNNNNNNLDDLTINRILKTNLIKNPSGEQEFAHWTILRNGGEGFEIETPAHRFSPLPPDPDFPEEKSNFVFSTSYEWGTKEQKIDLWEEGLTPEIMKMLLPFEFTCSEWIGARFDCGGYYKLEINILDNAGRKISQRGKEIEGHLKEGSNWEKISISIYVLEKDKDHLKHFRHLSFKDSGKDDKYWGGSGHRYGSKFARASVRIRKLPKDFTAPSTSIKSISKSLAK